MAWSTKRVRVQRWREKANILAAALCLSCAPPSPARAPEPTRGAFFELESPHFVLKTNLAEGQARDLVDELERSYWALSQLAFPYPEPPRGVTQVIAFAGIEDMKPLGFGDFKALYDPGSLGLDELSFLLLPGDLTDREDTRELIYHELTHRFIRHHLPNVPRWLNEGLAEYYSTLAVGRGSVSFGQHLRSTTFGEQSGVGFADGNAYRIVAVSDLVLLSGLRALGGEVLRRLGRQPR